MNRKTASILLRIAGGITALSMLSNPAKAQDWLATVDVPDGSRILVYDGVTHRSTFYPEVGSGGAILGLPLFVGDTLWVKAGTARVTTVVGGNPIVLYEPQRYIPKRSFLEGVMVILRTTWAAASNLIQGSPVQSGGPFAVFRGTATPRGSVDQATLRLPDLDKVRRTQSKWWTLLPGELKFTWIDPVPKTQYRMRILGQKSPTGCLRSGRLVLDTLIVKPEKPVFSYPDATTSLTPGGYYSIELMSADYQLLDYGCFTLASTESKRDMTNQIAEMIVNYRALSGETRETHEELMLKAALLANNGYYQEALWVLDDIRYSEERIRYLWNAIVKRSGL